MKDFRDTPTQIGRPRRPKARRARRGPRSPTRAMAMRLAPEEPDARIHGDPRRIDAGPRARDRGSAPAGRSRGRPRRHRAAPAALGGHHDEARRGARATRPAISGSPVRPVTSLMMRAPASSAARAGTLRLVSAETGGRASREQIDGPGQPVGLLVLRDTRWPGTEPWTSRRRRRMPRPPAPWPPRAQQTVLLGHDRARVERFGADVERRPSPPTASRRRRRFPPGTLGSPCETVTR